jgi:ankyrin repeat protein
MRPTEQQSLWTDETDVGQPKARLANGAKLLRIAIDRQQLKWCTELLDAGADPDASETNDNNDWTPLIRAIVRFFPEAALLLIERGARLTAQGQNQFIPLHLAVTSGDLRICRALLQHGADLESKDSEGCTAIFRAVTGKIDVLRFLIEEGADVNVVTTSGASLLRNAARKDHAESANTLRALVAAGADLLLATIDSSGHVERQASLTAFQCAVASGAAQNAAVMIEEFGEDPHQITADGRSMIDLAPDDATRDAIRSAVTARAVTVALTCDPGEPNRPSATKEFMSL